MMSNQPINTTLINPVRESIHSVLIALTHMELALGDLKAKTKHEFVNGKSITGIMNLVGNFAQASIVITFPEPTILNLANKIMPETVERVDAVVIDLVGEITNMVSGGVKRMLENEGYLFDLSLPTIMMGSHYLIAYLPDAPIIVTSVSTSYGDFTVEASFEGSIDFCPLVFDGGSDSDYDDIFF